MKEDTGEVGACCLRWNQSCSTWWIGPSHTESSVHLLLGVDQYKWIMRMCLLGTGVHNIMEEDSGWGRSGHYVMVEERGGFQKTSDL